MDCIALCHGQDDWLEVFLLDVPGVDRVWGTMWSIESDFIAATVSHLESNAPARIVEYQEYSGMWSIVRRKAWKR